MAPKAKRNGSQQRNNDGDEGDDDGELFNEEQRSEITSLVNAAVSGQLQRKLPKAIADGIATPMGELRTLIEGMGTRGREDGGDEGDEEPPIPKGKKARRVVEADPEKEQMKTRLAAIETERKQEREQNRNRDRDTSLREHLTKLGVDPNRIRGAIAVLRDSTKYDEKSGEWSYVAKRDGYDEDVDLGVGAKEWAGTDEGKSYLAPTGAGARGGSGTRVPAGGSTVGSGGAARGAGQPIADPKQAKAQAKQQAVASLAQAVNELGGGTIGIG